MSLCELGYGFEPACFLLGKTQRKTVFETSQVFFDILYNLGWVHEPL